jgi:hypothetical protein
MITKGLLAFCAHLEREKAVLPNSPIPKIEHLGEAKLATDERGWTPIKQDMVLLCEFVFPLSTHDSLLST